MLNNVNSADFAEPPTVDDVSCPASIPVEAGPEFECKVDGVGDRSRSGHAWVKVKDQGRSGRPVTGLRNRGASGTAALASVP
ncbi:hypothetical protein [Streptomyces sp. bgisy031]|uniref:hypothetical protein n=1 Tax=Streptomyces sp. bgisy031 TaxID=3413772 RepID=UPI003D7200A9